MKKQCLLLMTLMCSLFYLASCGYHLGVKPVGGIRSIFVASVKNDTEHAFINESEAAGLVSREFQRDGAVRVTSEDLADARLQITLTKYNQRAEVFDTQDVGQRFKMSIRAKALVTRSSSGEILYSGDLEGFAEYSRDFDQFQIERLASSSAISDLAIKIVRAVMEGDW